MGRRSAAICSAARSVGEWAARWWTTAMRMVSTLVGIAPRGELADSRLHHLVGKESCVFPQHRRATDSFRLSRCGHEGDICSAAKRSLFDEAGR
jgi:hypothetical protein